MPNGNSKLAAAAGLRHAGQMGQMVEGQWTTEWYTPDAEGRFVRGKTSFRDRITRDGSSGFGVEPGRYHLYVSYACPWAHRTLIVRSLLGLQDFLPVSVVDPFMGDSGWTFSEGPGCIPDSENGATCMWEIYKKARSDYTGRVTVPVLWDKKTSTIVNNESREIIRMLDDALGGEHHPEKRTYCPPALRADIDRTIDENYDSINNGVYRAGFATTQKAYEEAVKELFAALARVEATLGKSRFLCGSVLTEADICLFTTLLRFDPVYHGHFKCNLRQIKEYPNLWGFVRDVFQTPGVAETVRLDHIKQHYYRSHPMINPTRIVPVGPEIDFTSPHGRDRF